MKADTERITKAIGKLIIAIGMHSENQERLAGGIMQPYRLDDFEQLVDDLLCVEKENG